MAKDTHRIEHYDTQYDVFIIPVRGLSLTLGFLLWRHTAAPQQFNRKSHFLLNMERLGSIRIRLTR